MSKVSRRLYQALEAKYTADIMDARARLSVYFENPCGDRGTPSTY